MATSFQGTISFVHHEKDYCTIDYLKDGKKKTINGSLTGKTGKSKQQFHVSDTVSFNIEQSPRGDRMIATNITFLYNNALSDLLNRAKTSNVFNGYLKLVGEDYFVKETGSYFFFPVIFSPWELKPPPEVLNEPVLFSLENIEKPSKVTAVLNKRHFIPEFHKAETVFNSKLTTPAKITNITPHGIYVNLFGGKIKAKIPLSKDSKPAGDAPILVGDRIEVTITHLSPSKIVVKKADSL